TAKALYSQFNLQLWVKRAGLGMLMRLHFALFSAVAIAMLCLFIRATELDPRFGIPVGAFFAAVANTYVGATMLPDTGTLALADIINGLGMLTIFLILLESVVSLHIISDWQDEELSHGLDRVTAIALTLLYVGSNLSMVVAAAA